MKGVTRPRVHGRCHYCPCPAATRDHIVPQCVTARAEPNVPNIVPACGPCNSAKGALPSTCQCPRCVAARAFYGNPWWAGLRPVLLPPPRCACRVAEPVRRPLPPEVQWCFRCDLRHLVGAHTLGRRALGA